MAPRLARVDLVREDLVTQTWCSTLASDALDPPGAMHPSEGSANDRVDQWSPRFTEPARLGGATGERTASGDPNGQISVLQLLTSTGSKR